jgi:hypothetical protein
MDKAGMPRAGVPSMCLTFAISGRTFTAVDEERQRRVPAVQQSSPVLGCVSNNPTKAASTELQVRRNRKDQS